jgi:hypothetical protein
MLPLAVMPHVALEGNSPLGSRRSCMLGARCRKGQCWVQVEAWALSNGGSCSSAQQQYKVPSNGHSLDRMQGALGRKLPS